MGKLKANILLEVMDDIIIEYSDTKDFMQQKLVEKCDREGISVDKIILFILSKFRSKTFLQTRYVIYQSLHMLLAGLKM